MVRPKFSFPLPLVTKVKETILHRDSFCIIAPDYSAGRRNRFTVIRVFRRKNSVRCIGRELPLGYSRRIAERSSKEDGTPLE